MRKNRMFTESYFLILYLLVLIVFFSNFMCNPLKVKASSELTVHFIDVGLGDSALIECNGKYMLIDAGPGYKNVMEDASTGTEESKVVLNYLKDHGISHLEYVIATHPHADHIGGLIHIIEDGSISIGTLYTTTCSYTSGTYKRLESYIKLYNINRIYPKSGSTILLNTAKIQFLSPISGYNYSLVNDYSIACRLTYGSNSFLFTGDMEAASQKLLINSGILLKSDVLKVPHHAVTKTPVTQGTLNKALYDVVQAKYAVISRDITLTSNARSIRELGAYGSTYQTNNLGTIIMKSNGSNITVSSAATNPPTDFISVSSKTDRIKLIDISKEDTYYRCDNLVTLNFTGKCGVENYKKTEYMIVKKGKKFDPKDTWTTGRSLTISTNNFQGRVYVRYTDSTGRKIIKKTTGFTVDTKLESPKIKTTLTGLKAQNINKKDTYKYYSNKPITFYFSAYWPISNKKETAYQLVKRGSQLNKNGKWTIAKNFTLSTNFTGCVYARFTDRAGNVEYRKTQGFTITGNFTSFGTVNNSKKKLKETSARISYPQKAVNTAIIKLNVSPLDYMNYKIYYKKVAIGKTFTKTGSWKRGSTLKIKKKFKGCIYVKFVGSSGEVFYKKTVGINVK